MNNNKTINRIYQRICILEDNQRLILKEDNIDNNNNGVDTEEVNMGYAMEYIFEDGRNVEYN